MNSFRVLSKIGLLLVLLGCLMPVHLNMNVIGLADFVSGFSDTLINWLLTGTLFYSCIAGLVIGIFQIAGKEIDIKYDLMAVLLCIGSGFGLLFGVALPIAAIAILLFYHCNRMRIEWLTIVFGILSLAFFAVFVINALSGDIYKVGDFTYFHFGALLIFFGWSIALVCLILSEPKYKKWLISNDIEPSNEI